MPEPLPGQDAVFVESVEISSLFGKYEYRLPKDGGGLNPRLFILYGDNGTGKTTILFLLHHLLSRSTKRGHKSAIARVPFKFVNVNFSNGNSLRVERSDPSSRDFTFRICRGQTTVIKRLYVANSFGIIPPMEAKGDVQAEENLNNVYDQLIGLQSYTLTDDRQLDSDQLADEYLQMTEGREDEKKGIQVMPYRRLGLDSALSDSHLASAIQRAGQWADAQFRSDTSSGTTNVNAIYLDLLNRIGSGKQKEQSNSPDQIRSALVTKVNRLEDRIEQHVKFGLEPPLPTDHFRERIWSMADRDIELAAHVLEPYFDGVDARLKAQQTTVHTIYSFLSTLNQYYRDKKVLFHAESGFMVQYESGDHLPTRSLSSGERQLLTIFCNVMAARANPCLFMVDEPEISLNIKWQRRLVDSLLECTLNSGIQLAMASHSFELLSAHSEDVVTLNQGGGM